MSVFATKLTGLLGGALAVAGGSYWLYSSNLPKDLKGSLERDGHSLATSDKVFKALFFDRKSDISSQSIDSFSNLKTWCEDKYKKQISEIENLEEIKKQALKLCEDKDFTVRGHLIKMGKEEFEKDTSEDDYKVTFSVYKSDKDFLDLLKAKNTSLKDNSDIQTGYTTLKNWCEDNFAKNPKEDLHIPFKQISWYCTSLGYKTVNEKLTKENWKKADEASKSSVWNDLFEKWKHTKKVTDAINKSYTGEQVNSDTPKETGGSKLKDWCEAGLKKNLYDSGVYPDEYVLLKSACSEDSLKSRK